MIRKLLVYDSYTLFWQKLRFEIFGRVRGGTPRSIFSDFDILAFNLRLDPPWRPNGPSERVLKPTMPSPTFDSEHISPKQPFSKVIISDPGKHLKFRIFLKIRIHGQSHIYLVTRPWPWPWPWPWPSAEGLKTYSRALLDMIIWDKNHGRLPRLRRGPPSVPYPSFWAKMIVYDRIEDKINSQVIWPYFTHWPPHSQNRPKKWKKVKSRPEIPESTYMIRVRLLCFWPVLVVGFRGKLKPTSSRKV